MKMNVKCPRCGDPAPERYQQYRCRTCMRAKATARERVAAAERWAAFDADLLGKPTPRPTAEERKVAIEKAFRQRAEEILTETPYGPRRLHPAFFATPELIAQIAELMGGPPAATGEQRPRRFTDWQWLERQRRAEIQSRWQPATTEYLREVHARIAAGRGKTQRP